MNKNKEIWEPFDFPDEGSWFFRIGPLKIWMERHSDEWFIASDYQQKETGCVRASKRSRMWEEKPEDLVLRRIVATTDTSRITFVPVMNEKPIVVGAERPLTILSKNEALIFINVPASIRIMAGTKKQALLYELPSVVLSNTWIGSPAVGELCLSLKTSAVRSKDLMLDRPNRIGCPVLIRNRSDEPLEMEKICVHTENLAIYLGSSRLWTNKVTINYLGSDRSSEVKRGKIAPKMEEEETLISHPRVPAKDGIFSLSINLFRILSEDWE